MNTEQKIEALKMARELGLTAKDLSEIFNIDQRQVQEWMDRYKKETTK